MVLNGAYEIQPRLIHILLYAFGLFGNRRNADTKGDKVFGQIVVGCVVAVCSVPTAVSEAGKKGKNVWHLFLQRMCDNPYYVTPLLYLRTAISGKGAFFIFFLRLSR